MVKYKVNFSILPEKTVATLRAMLKAGIDPDGSFSVNLSLPDYLYYGTSYQKLYSKIHTVRSKVDEICDTLISLGKDETKLKTDLALRYQASGLIQQTELGTDT